MIEHKVFIEIFNKTVIYNCYIMIFSSKNEITVKLETWGFSCTLKKRRERPRVSP